MLKPKVPVPPKLGKNIFKIRKENRMSLDILAKKSGVSKAMISQVEQEKTNPTLATVWKISHGLGISLEDLLGKSEQTEKKFEICTKENIPILFNNKKDVRFDILSTLDMQNIEIYLVAIKKGGALNSTKHYPKTEETVYSLDGTAEIKIGEKTAIIKPGDIIRYHADVNHSIKNKLKRDIKLFMVVRFNT